ncbi:hypothetical protein RND71_013745 [Anisodus tanguticus]|uniref:Uncharacterized protein n=1 Tax=Anisodus tanguticus TaxID=243964 RepID=A0AAE1S9E7_9SOLA|nr:hypothetical protein RND71_013745 [Anisodus tanguticus]
MGDVWAWLLFFFILISLLVMVVFQLMCLSDLEFDYINPYDSASRINGVVLPEFITQGVLCLLYLITGHWVMSLLCVPYMYYNYRLEGCGATAVGAGSRGGGKKGWRVVAVFVLVVALEGYGAFHLRNGSYKRSMTFVLSDIRKKRFSEFKDGKSLHSIFLQKNCCDRKGYTRRQHLVDVTEIFNLLNWEKKQRLFKLGYIILLLCISLFWLIYSALEDDEESL